MENKDGMKVFLEQAVWFLSDLKQVIADIEDIRATTTLKTDTKQEIQSVYNQLDTIVEWLNKQSKKVWDKIEKLETMLIGIINESNKRTKTAQDKLKEELKADITAFWPILKEVKDMIWLVERDIKREYEKLEEKVSIKLEKSDLDAINKKLKKKLIDDENISEKTAYSSKKTIEKIDSMINNLRLWGRGKLFILNEWSDLWQANAINFTGATVDVTVVNGVHTVNVTWWWGYWDVVWPASATDGNIALYDWATGKLIKNSTYSPASFAPALTSDQNYVTAAQLVVIGNTSWINTGDQNLSWLVPYTWATVDLNMWTYDVITDTLRSSTSAWVLIESTNGTDVGIFWSGNTANVEWYGSHNYSTATQDTIAIFTGVGKTLWSATTATYPSLTELAYVKWVTSAIQTQLNAKLGLSWGTVTWAIVLDENASLQLDWSLSADGKWSGTTITATAWYTQAFWDLVYLDPTDSRREACDANAASGADWDCRGLIGMVVSAWTDWTACTILLNGTIRADANFPTLTVGWPVFAAETAWDVVTTAPATSGAVVRVLGSALTADSMYFNPSRDFIVNV